MYACDLNSKTNVFENRHLTGLRLANNEQLYIY